MIPCRDLTLDDVKDIQNMKGDSFDILAAVAGRAKKIYDDHVAAHKANTSYDDGQPSTSSPRKKTKRNSSPKSNPQSPPPPPPPLPREFDTEIRKMARGKILTPPTLVIQKCLYGTDLSSGHNRLSIPFSLIKRDDFLTKEEKRYVRKHNAITKKKNYMEVTIIEPNLGRETVKFSRWDMAKSNGGKTSSSYVINGKWSAIVSRNKLKLNMKVQLWSFRVDQDLCFALVCLPPPNN